MIIECGNSDYKLIQFEWFLTNWCNFSCTYCSEITRLVDKFDKQSSPGKYKLVLSRLKTVKEEFVIELIGGEPTLHPNITEILLGLSEIDNCKDIQLITNLSKPLHFYQSILSSPNSDKIELLCSFHPEHYKQEWLEKILVLKNSRISVTLNLIDDPLYWPLTLQMIDTLIDNNVIFAYNILSTTPKWTADYTGEFYNIFNPYIDNGKNNESISCTFDNGTTKVLHETEIIKNRFHYLKGYQCTPIRYRITHDGDIHNFCTGRKLPLMIASADIFKQEVCPNECCGCDAVFKFYKKRL